MANPEPSEVTPHPTLIGSRPPKTTSTCIRHIQLNAIEAARRLVPVKLDVAAARVCFRDGARLLRPTLNSLQRSAKLPAKHLRFRISQKRELEIRHQVHLRSLRIKDIGRSAPLGSVLDNLNKLWDLEDTETRARVLKRARRRTITYYKVRYQSTPSMSRARDTNLYRKNFRDTEKNWFSSSQRPLSMASSFDETLQAGNETRPRSLRTISESSTHLASFGNRGKAPMKDQDSSESSEEYDDCYYTSPRLNRHSDPVKQRRRQTVVYAEPVHKPFVRYDNGDDTVFNLQSDPVAGTSRARPKSMPNGLASLDNHAHYAVYDPSVYHGGHGQRLVRLVPVTPVLAQARYRHRDDPARVPPGAHLGTNYTTYVRPPRRPLSYSPGDFEHIGCGYNQRDETEDYSHRSETDPHWEDVDDTRNPSPGPSTLRYELRRTSNVDDIDNLRHVLQDQLRLAEPEDPDYHPPNCPTRRPMRTVVDERVGGNWVRSVISTPGRPPITPANSLRRPRRTPSKMSPFQLQRTSSRSTRVSVRRTSSQRSRKAEVPEEPPIPEIPANIKLIAPAAPPNSDLTPQCKRLLETQNVLLQRKIKRATLANHHASKRASTYSDVQLSGSNSPTSTMVAPRAENRRSDDSKVSDREEKRKQKMESPLNSESGKTEFDDGRESKDKISSGGTTGTPDPANEKQDSVKVPSTGSDSPTSEEAKPTPKKKLGRRLLKPYFKVYWLLRNSRYPGGKASRT